MDCNIYQVITRGKLQRVVVTAHLAAVRQPSWHESGEIGVVATDLGAIRSVPGDAEDKILHRPSDGIANTEAGGAAAL